MTGYEKIKALARDRNCPVRDLLALAPKNDPYYAGSEGSRQKAEWFASLWRSFGYEGKTGIHLRRVHYQLVSQPDPLRWDGRPYENTENNWKDLCEAGKQARYLGLVDPEAFVDRRNPEPHIFRPADYPERPGWRSTGCWWFMPEIRADLSGDLDWSLPWFEITGFEYSESMQPYHLEVWVEKSTMDDVLIPICRGYGVNLVTGLGFMSITSVIALIRRVAGSRKPTRIFYVSDFDPAGDGMPVAVARQIEYWLNQYAPGLDVKLNPIVLTREQVEKHRLPRIPVKDSDRRKAHFEERYGEGAVELDALEALYPGELARIVAENIRRFRDEKLARKVQEAKREFERRLEEAWKKNVLPYRGKLDELREKVEIVARYYQDKLYDLKCRMEDDLYEYSLELEELRQAVEKAVNEISVEAPELPEAETPPEPEDWLFDSSRSYEEQLAAYRERKNGNAEREED
ncbi:hypothetical protein G7K71_02705 [Desulfofundulus sp. TPOSR]|uniref:hypothetical protein n=1 Tax=Desulfofundulus sp. TPOSR TaxID=2714340 RepID=UPI00140DDF17|nr:hypothetical protein [Desulfofundulus sp. TPOSR]NHM25936.1 hypothetical protein [Desulfofundulus sp. TPOSR]